jgi:hypothetical protein
MEITFTKRNILKEIQLTNDEGDPNVINNKLKLITLGKSEQLFTGEIKQLSDKIKTLTSSESKSILNIADKNLKSYYKTNQRSREEWTSQTLLDTFNSYNVTQTRGVYEQRQTVYRRI